jgi:membrane protease YdiL (CAAX protease family)
VIAFVLLAYAWTWGLGLIVYALTQLGEVPDAAVMVAETLIGFGPVLAALLITARSSSASLKELLSSLVRWRVSPIWYIIALFGPALVAVAGATFYFGPDMLAYDRLWPAILTRYVPVALLTMVTAGPIQEELGWRGFALPRLQARFGPLVGSAILGGVWAAWHLPNVMFRGWSLETTGFFLVATFLIAYAYTWLVNGAAGSVLLAMLLHAGINTSNRLVSTLVPESALPGFEATIYAIMAVAYGFVALLLLAGTSGRLLVDNRSTRAVKPN